MCVSWRLPATCFPTLQHIYCSTLDWPLTYKYLTFSIYAFFIYLCAMRRRIDSKQRRCVDAACCWHFLLSPGKLTLLTVICHTRAKFVESTSRVFRVSACFLLPTIYNSDNWLHMLPLATLQWVITSVVGAAITQILLYYITHLLSLLANYNVKRIWNKFVHRWVHIKIARRMFNVRTKVHDTSKWRSLLSYL